MVNFVCIVCVHTLQCCTLCTHTPSSEIQLGRIRSKNHEMRIMQELIRPLFYSVNVAIAPIFFFFPSLPFQLPVFLLTVCFFFFLILFRFVDHNFPLNQITCLLH